MRRSAPVCVLVLALSATAAAAPRPTPTPTPVPSAPVGPEPQRTTATYEDWTLRCIRPANGPAACEVGQILADNGQPVAQTALGRPPGSEGMRLTLQVPSNVLLTTPPRFQEGPGGTAIELTWRRCLPNGCFADTPLSDEQLTRLRERKENSRVTFTDGANREVALPFVPRGLGAALAALTKEDAHQ